MESVRGPVPRVTKASWSGLSDVEGLREPEPLLALWPPLREARANSRGLGSLACSPFRRSGIPLSQRLWILIHSGCGTLRPAPQCHKRTFVHALQATRTFVHSSSDWLRDQAKAPWT